MAKLAKQKTIYECKECGYQTPKWIGKCPDCNKWNTIVEMEIVLDKNNINVKTSLTTTNNQPKLLSNIKATTYDRIKTNINEFDRVLGGGIVKDGVVILTAEPGTGKSTILMQVSDNVSKQNYKVLYISGEENEGQLKSRAERLGVKDIKSNLYIVSECDINKISKFIEDFNPDLIVIDSIQKMYDPNYPENLAGEKVQVKRCTEQLVKIAKNSNKALFIIGQQNKGNELAGPREMEHAVDCVLYFESDLTSSLRVMRASKNRFGNTDEIGLFEMTERGLISIDNPSDILITKRDKQESGVGLTVSLEGSRPLVIEIECLARNSFYPNPMIVSEHINIKKINILTAILGMKGGVFSNNKDLFIQVTGGLIIKEPAVNLGILMAMASSILDKPLSDKTIYLGEVSLTGDIKKVNNIERRIRELDRLGFEKVYIPKNNLKEPLNTNNIKIVEVKHVRELTMQLKNK